MSAHSDCTQFIPPYASASSPGHINNDAIHISQESHRFCYGQIDPTQAVKATGFNHRGHREHRVVKPILCVPLCSLWLYSLPMSFMLIALLCIRLTITESHRFIQLWSISAMILKPNPSPTAPQTAESKIPPPAPFQTSPQPPPGQHTRVAEPEQRCLLHQPPSQVAYRDFPVFTAPLMALDGAHRTMPHHAILPRFRGARYASKPISSSRGTGRYGSWRSLFDLLAARHPPHPLP